MIDLGGLSVDEGDLLTSRSCIIAQSGAGKSYGVAVICESLAEANLGFCVIDTEGEYYSLASGFDLLVIGPKGINLKSVNLQKLAREVIKEGVGLVFDVSEVSDPQVLVDEWVQALYEAADELRIPYLLVLEEADKFIPQRGEKLPIFQEVARRGRKRGLGLLLASQRPALIDKEVLSQCNHQFIGKLTVKNDIRSISHFFSDRSDLKSLPELLPGEFFSIGFSPKEELFKFKERLTVHSSDTPIIKERLPAHLKDVLEDVVEVNGFGVKPLISLSEARELALKHCRRKFLLFGEREVVKSVELINKPLLELELKVNHKRLLGHEWVQILVHFSQDLVVVDEFFNELFDLFFLSDLSSDEVKVLLAILYEGSRTINDLVKVTGFSESITRSLIKNLLSKDLVSWSGWRGRDRLLESVSVDIPRLISLQSELLTSSEPVSDCFEFDLKKVESVLSLLGEFELISSRTLFFPFYRVVLERDFVTREFLINALSGDLC